MFTPKYPTPDTPPARPLAPAPTDTAYVPAPASPVAPAPVPTSSAPVLRMTPTGLAAAVAGGTAAVLVVGAVLVSMLLAVAITAVSVTVCVVVLRSLLNQTDTR